MSKLLRAALPLVRSHGFTRDALALSVLHLPPPDTHATPLSDSAISALFGAGLKAEHSLLNFFFDEGIQHMKERAQSQGRQPTVKEMLEERLMFNEPVLDHLSTAFASLASSPLPLQIPMLDPLPGLKHALKIADEACYLSGDTSTELSWYARRASLAAIYTAAELHQITSPQTTLQFLDSLLESSSQLKKSVDEVGLFASYLFKSSKAILKSSGAL
ncbi:hypothetical protein AGABI1DRAFT_75470 [Agaricus bisporus var. burnettii JB137-S8]|uniref:Ubiquinone biosynthesis protein n=1 Tax=Agaricus bisporus var. burnettii (strain JB137-S8 / ATCC MYA-4627 / FGSC 10392) TaxID=597362 RepID=K5XUU5_AGABU|nr:uncharacterized protein AGABI1DRAFT_75470 [Agaricus bisporus var. burnettii JB137-S8]EKM78890.1 hypothetical protein AGABI1DRAFT_75470 [Agaricus bisporus var. burnettii JB137-S8]